MKGTEKLARKDDGYDSPRFVFRVILYNVCFLFYFFFQWRTNGCMGQVNLAGFFFFVCLNIFLGNTDMLEPL